MRVVNFTIRFVLLAGWILVSGCSDNGPVNPDTIDPDSGCITDEPVEDTTRVYLWPIITARDTLSIYPKAVFARFYPTVTDTSKIKQVLKKFNLRVLDRFFMIDQQLAAFLCVTDGRRAEYHFTPYGKEGFCNFGADPLVEYAFGMFDNGHSWPLGDIVFRFIDGTPEERIDSLFNANGLRFLRTVPDFPSGNLYVTLVTPRSSKNVLDLGYELQFLPFAQYVSAEIAFSTVGISCD